MSSTPHSSAWARERLHAVWDPAKWGPVELREAGILAIARLETGYAKWKPGACENCNNWGSMHDVSRKGCEGIDTRPNGKKYTAWFLVYPTPEEGLIAFISLLHARSGIWAALPSRDATTLAVAMRAAKYYEGRGATEADRIASYETALFTASNATARQLGIPALALTRAAGSQTLGVVLMLGGLAGVGAWLWWERRRRAAS